LIGPWLPRKKKGAGLQTYTLVTLGSCILTIIAMGLFNVFDGKNGISFDPSRIVLAVATGVGFIGAGVIFHRESHVEGITTAAGLWTVAAIGVAIGAKFYFLALAATFFAIFVLLVFGEIEKKFLKREG
jgi:putative Mg2+ transporter-C (MgtC) family protein